MNEIITQDLTKEERKIMHAAMHLRLAISIAEGLKKETVEVNLSEAKVLADVLARPEKAWRA